MTSPRRVLVTAAMAATLCLLPTRSQAQEGCYFDIGVYVDGYYEPDASTVYTWGSGIDYSYCPGGYCYHTYQFATWIRDVPSGQILTQTTFEGGSGETSAPVVAPGTFEYGDMFVVGCNCYGGSVEVGASGTIEVPPAQSGPCVPPLAWGFLTNEHRYGFSDDPLWFGFAGTVRDAASGWNYFIWNYSSQNAFWESFPRTIILRMDWELVGTPVLGRADPWGYWLNPDLFQHSYWYAVSVAMHEFGHSRGYGHIDPSCPMSDSIMYPYASPGGAYASGFGPGDVAAVIRDLQ